MNAKVSDNSSLTGKICEADESSLKVQEQGMMTEQQKEE
jgi:hypothetical protein